MKLTRLTLRKLIEEQVLTKKKLYVLVGPPSVGKSSWIRKWKVENQEQPFIISRDDIVEEVAKDIGFSTDELFIHPDPKISSPGDVYPKYGVVQVSPTWMKNKLSYSNVLKANDEVENRLNARKVAAVNSGQTIILDMTNMNKKSRARALKIVAGRENEFEKIAVDFKFQGVESVIKTVAKMRAKVAAAQGIPKDVPENFIDDMINAYEPPTLSEGFDRIEVSDNRQKLIDIASKGDISGLTRESRNYYNYYK